MRDYLRYCRARLGDSFLALVAALALKAQPEREPYAVGTGRRGRRTGRGERVRRTAALAVAVAFGVIATILISPAVLDHATWRAPAPKPTVVRAPDIGALGPGPVLGPPSIDVATIRRELESYNSPAADQAQALYDLGVAYGIDPAYCLAFFIMESSAGTQGVARRTYSLGNIRARAGEPSYEGYRRYTSWREGIEDWYRLIDELYVGQWGLTTVDEIIPIYAPSHDNNDPDAYIRRVKTLVARWRGL